jgi:phage tail-like protein
MASGTEQGHANCRFYVKIGNDAEAMFTEMGGLQFETAVTEYEEGGSNGYVHRLPGRTKISNITLKWGVTNSHVFYKWYLDILQGKFRTQNVTVSMYDAAGDVLASWDFLDAYPVKWVGPQLVADGKNAAIETLELAHSGLRLA